VTSGSEERLSDFLSIQRRFSDVPRGDELAWESFVTDDGRRRALVIHAVVGRRVNDALARALAAQIPLARAVSADLGFAILLPRGERVGPRRVRALFDAPVPQVLEGILPTM